MPTFEDVDVNNLLPPYSQKDIDLYPQNKDSDEEPLFLTPKEVADFFGVNPKTVTRWANAGKLNGKVRIIRTPGNHRRFRTEDVKKLLEAYDA